MCQAAPQTVWKVKQVPGMGWYRLLSAASDREMCMDVVAGANMVQVWTCARRQANQLFEVLQDSPLLVKASHECIGYGKGQHRTLKAGSAVTVVPCHAKRALSLKYLTVPKSKQHSTSPVTKEGSYFKTLKQQEATIFHGTSKEELDSGAGVEEEVTPREMTSTVQMIFAMSFICFVLFCISLTYVFYQQYVEDSYKKTDDKIEII